MFSNSDKAAFGRRQFLADVGMGFTGLALGAMLAKDRALEASPHPDTWTPPTGQPIRPPKAKNVIWIFLVGGTSQMESFDPKPALTKYSGLTIQESPYADTLNSPYLKNSREVIEGLHKVHPKIYPLQVGWKHRGESGLEISDWFPHIGSCADDISLVRSMWTTDNNHGAQLQFHTGRHVLEGRHPTIGSWVHYGLGSLNDNFPQFVVMGTPIADCCGGAGAHGADYLGPEHHGVQLGTDPKNPLPFATPKGNVLKEEQARQFELLGDLNRLAAVEYPEDDALRARIKSYELAYRMQSAIPDVVDVAQESKTIQDLYGIEGKETATFGRQCLVARRLVEKGVRFVQLFHGSNGGAGAWDAHSNLQTGHARLSGQIDQPIGALIKDLKQRGLLEDTLIVVGTEFGRTPGAQNSNGRDHHPYGFSVMLAGGGVKAGHAYGKTDELGFHAIENRHYVTDLHATVLHQLGLDPRRLEIPGHKRLEIDFGKPITGILS